MMPRLSADSGVEDVLSQSDPEQTPVIVPLVDAAFCVEAAKEPVPAKIEEDVDILSTTLSSQIFEDDHAEPPISISFSGFSEVLQTQVVNFMFHELR